MKSKMSTMGAKILKTLEISAITVNRQKWKDFYLSINKKKFVNVTVLELLF